RNQPAVYVKILALLVPREMQIEHTNRIKQMTDEEIEQAIEAIQTMLAARAGEAAKVIEGSVGPAALPAPNGQSSEAALEPVPLPKPKQNHSGLRRGADTGGGRGERIRPKMRPPVTSDLYDMARRLLRTGGSSVRRDGSCPAIVSSSKILESVGRHFGVPDR